MGMCPICNHFREVSISCPKCGEEMKHEGREADYYDDYSPYMPIDQMKLEDGYPTDLKQGECPHVFYCSQCERIQTFLIKE